MINIYYTLLPVNDMSVKFSFKTENEREWDMRTFPIGDTSAKACTECMIKKTLEHEYGTDINLIRIY